MIDFILALHSYNVYLVILAGAVTAIWGLILFFSSKKDSKSKTASIESNNPAVNNSETSSSETSSPEVSTLAVRAKPWRKALLVTVILSLLQGLFGVIMALSGLKPGPAGSSLYYLHFVYGGIVALVIPVATTYATSSKNLRRDILVYSLAALILTAAAVRAWLTGPAVFTLLP